MRKSKTVFIVKARRIHQGVVKVRTFESTAPVVPPAAFHDGWTYVSHAVKAAEVRELEVA
jgi:hypothetical protein